MKINDFFNYLFFRKPKETLAVEAKSIQEDCVGKDKISPKKATEIIESLNLGFESINYEDKSFNYFKEVSFFESFECKNYVRGYRTNYMGFIVEYYISYLRGVYYQPNSYITLILYKNNEVVLKRTTLYSIETLKERILKDFRSVIKSYSYIPDQIMNMLSVDFKRASMKAYNLCSIYDLMKHADLRCLKNKNLYTIRSDSYKNIIGIGQKYKNYRDINGTIYEKNNWSKIGHSNHIGCFNEKDINKYVEKNLRLKNEISFDGKIDASILTSITDNKKEYIEININGYIFYIVDYVNMLILFEMNELVNLENIDNIYNDKRIKILKKIEVNMDLEHIHNSFFDKMIKARVYSSEECAKGIYYYVIKYALSLKDRESLGLSSNGPLNDDEIKMVELLIY